MESKFNVLIDELPSGAVAGGVFYPIRSDFRNVFSYVRMLGDDTLSQQEKTLMALVLFYGETLPEDLSPLAQYLTLFINLGEETEASTGPRLFDLLGDSGRVYAAFRQVYRIDLRQARAHWWVFCELLEGLPNGTHLAEVIDIRGRKFEEWMKPSDRTALQRLKDRYAIGGEQVDVITGLFESLRGLAGG